MLQQPGKVGGHVRIVSIDVPVQVIVDGHTAGRIDPGGRLDVRMSDDHATLARVAGTSFFRRYLETFSH